MHDGDHEGDGLNGLGGRLVGCAVAVAEEFMRHFRSLFGLWAALNLAHIADMQEVPYSLRLSRSPASNLVCGARMARFRSAASVAGNFWWVLPK